MPAETTDPRPIFAAMFAAVRHYLLSEGQAESVRAPVATNPKGEATRGFDRMAEHIALDVARDGLGSFRAFSEEAGEIVVGADPRWTLVLDPCDGSNNYKRGIRSVGFAVAALPVGAPLDPDLVAYAVCGDVYTGAVYSAARGQGATLDGRPCRISRQSELRYAVLGANIGRERLPHAKVEDRVGEPKSLGRVLDLISRASTIRRTGATVLDLCYVAQGAYDAYVDLRDRLTPENFLAPSLVIREAGGCLTDAGGQPLGTVAFTQPYSVLAAGSEALLTAIAGMLAGR